MYLYIIIFKLIYKIIYNYVKYFFPEIYQINRDFNDFSNLFNSSEASKKMDIDRYL